jgi:hypothetical protein
MTDQTVVRPNDFAQPRHRETETRLRNLADTISNHVSTINSQSSVQAIAVALKDLTYDQAQEVGAGLAQAMEANSDKEKGFDFSASPIKLAPVLAHLVQTWASTVKNAIQDKKD